MLNIIPILVTLIMLSFAFWYSWQIYRGKIKPALSTWLIMLVGTSLSLITFLLASQWDLRSGILNFADILTTIIIVASTLIWSGLKTKFRPFEKWYLLAATGIVIFWIVSGNSFNSNLLIQFLMLIGYFPTIQKLISEKKNTESFSAWSIAMSATLLALYPTIIGGKILSIIYVGRTIVMISIILGLMLYFEKKSSRIIN